MSEDRSPAWSRRRFLRGASGAVLALPLLPSLLRGRALAAAQAAPPPKRMVALASPHGGVWQEHMYPGDATLTHASAPYDPAHEMRWGPLTRAVDGSHAALSPVLSAPATALTQAVVDRMFVVRGCDVPFYIAHHTGGFLGNFARHDDNDTNPVLAYRPTIDQVMAWSPSFYPSLSAIRQRSLHIGRQRQGGISWGWSQPQTGSGQVQGLPTAYSSRALFDSIFAPELAGGGPRRPVIDRVLEQYRGLVAGTSADARRLSHADRQRLNAYVGRLDELDRKLSVTSQRCGGISRPAEDATADDAGFGGWTEDLADEDAITCDQAAVARYYRLFNDVIVAAFLCDTSRIVTVHGSETFSTSCNHNAWHQNVAHRANADPTKQAKMWRSKQWFFEHVWLDLVGKLAAADDGGGATLLDRSLVWWAQESGVLTHEADALPIVAAGSADGFFATGRYYDYRNRNNGILVAPWVTAHGDLQRRPGLLWNQWLATVLQAMGVAPREFERDGARGYGLLHNTRTTAYARYCEERASDVLPFIRGS